MKIIIRDVTTLFKQEDDYYKPRKAGNFWNESYIKHKNSDGRKKALTVKLYLHKIKPYSTDAIISLQKSDV